METYENINEKIKNMEDQQIISVKPNNLISTVTLIVGAILALLGIIRILDIQTVNLIFIIGGCALIIYGIITLVTNSNKVGFIYTPTGKKLKTHKIYLNQANMQKFNDCVEHRNFSSLKNINKEMNANKMLVVMAPDDASILLLQMFEYIPYNYEATTPITILKEQQAVAVLDFCKK